MIVKQITLPNGAVAGYHKVQNIHQAYPFTHTNIEVQSYTSEDAFLSGSGMMWSHRMAVAELDVGGNLLDSAEAWLIGNPDSDFSDGIVAVDNSTTLEAAQARKWVEIKALRSVYEVGNFTYDGGVYQADVPRITGAATLAMMAKMAGKDFSTSWTLTDNSVRVLTGDEIMALGVAVGQYVDSLYAFARTKRIEIFAAESIEAVNAITWPAPSDNAVPHTMTLPGPTPTPAADSIPAATVPTTDMPTMDTLALVPHNLTPTE